jgi:GNAT superfamily N-acetyltransferase
VTGPASEGRVEIREARREDVGLLIALIGELADYEKLSDQVRATDELLDRALFGDPPSAEALIAERDGEPVGYALYFSTFSTFLAIQGIWLEDLYVRPEHRKGGTGRALLAAVAAKLRERGGGRRDW